MPLTRTALAAALLGAAGLLGCTGDAAGDGVDVVAASTGTPLDLLAGHDWSHFAGATAQADGVHIVPLGRVIVNQDGSGGQPNPPLNLRGPHLVVAKDVRVDWTVSGYDGTAAFLPLYGEPPVIYDEWRRERHSVRVGLAADRVEVTLWNDTKDKPVLDQKYGSGYAGTVALSLVHKGSQLIVGANGKTVATVADKGVFASGRIYFGADAAVGGRGWRLSQLTASALDGGSVAVVDAPALAGVH